MIKTDINYSKKESMKDKDRGTARHEAGHAVMSVYLRRGIEYVEITPDNDERSGCCMATDIIIDEIEDPLFYWKIEREAMIFIAGHIARVRVKKEKYRDWQKHGAEQDIKYIVDFAFRLHGYGEEVNKYIEDLWQKVSDILSTPLAQRQIEAVADALCIKRRLSGRAVRQIVKAVK
jgi:hypothetical protein